MTYKIVVYQKDQELRVRYILNDQFQTWTDKLLSEVNMAELLENVKVK